MGCAAVHTFSLMLLVCGRQINYRTLRVWPEQHDHAANALHDLRFGFPAHVLQHGAPCVSVVCCHFYFDQFVVVERNIKFPVQGFAEPMLAHSHHWIERMRLRFKKFNLLFGQFGVHTVVIGSAVYGVKVR